MKKIFILFLILFTSQLFAQTPARTVKFSTSPINRDSITTAIRDLKTLGIGGTIWVAAGIYTEPELIIPSGVTIIGGFPPSGATTLSSRTYPGVATTAYLSILNGNYQHRVATVSGTLDGFFITKGYAYANGTNGGGVLIDGGIVQNCILTKNIASKVASSPTTIPGTYIASIGDIYCTDGTILEPIYTIGSNGKYVATLDASKFTGHIPMGIVFYVDQAATSGHFYIMGIPKLSDDSKSVNTSYIWINTKSPGTDMDKVPDWATAPEAQTDTAGYTNTNNMVTEGNAWAAAGTPWTNFGQGSDNPGNSAVKYARYYDTPTGTLNRWYLPAAGQILQLWKVYPQMDACAKLLSSISGSWTILATLYGTGTQTIFPYTSYMYWTSSECEASTVWVLNTTSYPTSSAYLDKANKTAGNIIGIPIASIKL